MVQKNKQVESSAGGLFKGEHFDQNNPDMKLYWEKPTHDEINEMARAKGRGYPITSHYDVEAPGNEEQQMFTAGDGSGDIVDGETSQKLTAMRPTNVEWAKKVSMTGSEEDLPEPQIWQSFRVTK